MATMMRTRTAPAAAATAPERKLFRSRTVEKKAAVSEAKKAEQIKIIQNKLQLIAMDAAKIERLQDRIRPEIEECNANIAKQKKDIETALKAADLPGYTDGIWEALFETPITRGSREFHTLAVYNALKLEDFLSVVKVQATEMKNVMNEREIEKVSTFIPGEKKDPVFVCRKVAKKGK